MIKPLTSEWHLSGLVYVEKNPLVHRKWCLFPLLEPQQSDKKKKEEIVKNKMHSGSAGLRQGWAILQLVGCFTFTPHKIASPDTKAFDKIFMQIQSATFFDPANRPTVRHADRMRPKCCTLPQCAKLTVIVHFWPAVTVRGGTWKDKRHAGLDRRLPGITWSKDSCRLPL